MPFPDYLDRKPRIIFFTDFDCTVTAEDMTDWLAGVATEGFGPEKLRETSQAVMNHTMKYLEASRLQIESIKLGFDQCVEKAIAHVQLDERFLDFYNWASSAGIPVVVLSGGLTTLIEATLEKLIGRKPQDIEVVTNSVVTKEGFKSINEDGGAWRVQFRDDSIYGNDKARAIKLYLEHRETIDEADKPILLFAGDGISDLGAAGQTDLLFAKHGKDLVEYCRRRRFPFTEFRDWGLILKTTQELYYGLKSVADVVEESRRAKDICRRYISGYPGLEGKLRA